MNNPSFLIYIIMNINWESHSLRMLGLASIIFLIVVVIRYFFPQKRPNYWYGYNSSLSTKSQEHWDFAQSYYDLLMMKCALFMLGIGFLSSMFVTDSFIDALLSTPLIIIIAGFMRYKTERAIRKKFSKN